MNDYKAIVSAGTVSQEETRDKAYSEYDKFKVIQDHTFVSDFDKFNNNACNAASEPDAPLLTFDITPTDGWQDETVTLILCNTQPIAKIHNAARIHHPH